MKTFIVITAFKTDATTTCLSIIRAEDKDEAFGKFLDNQDLDVKEDKDLIQSILDEMPVGIAEIPENLVVTSPDYLTSIEINWYTSL